MTITPAPDSGEPAPPQRGLTRDERGRDVSEAQAEAEAQTSAGRRMLQSMSPRFVLSQAEGYPVVIKQFLQFCLILIYPAWVFAILAGAVFYYATYPLVHWVLYPLLKLLFWPVRAWMKTNRPEEYAASQEK